jgi:hypothetical protein
MHNRISASRFIVIATIYLENTLLVFRVIGASPYDSALLIGSPTISITVVQKPTLDRLRDRKAARSACQANRGPQSIPNNRYM